jgi:ribosomal protein S8
MNNYLIKNLISLKNASLNSKFSAILDYEVSILKMLNILYKNGIILSFKKITGIKKIIVFLRYHLNFNSFRYLKLVSVPSKFYYISYKNICKLYEKQRVVIVSTNEGFLTSFECKKKRKGGILLFIC